MIKNILAVAIVVALSACSSDDDDNNDTPTTDVGTTTETGAEAGAETGGETPVTTTPVVTDAPTGGGDAPVADTSAGTYIGSFGGGEGVYIIDNENQLSGLSIFADGRAQTLVGSVGAEDTFTGALQQFQHEASEVDPQVQSFASVASLADDLSIDVTILNGQSITNTAESDTAVSLLAAVDGDALTPATAAAVAGEWSAFNTFGGNGDMNLTTSMTFDGTSVTGSTFLTLADGTDTTPAPIAGGITEFGDAAIIEFTWNGVPDYKGVVFFNPNGDGRLVFVGQNPGANEENGFPLTIGAVMDRVP